MESGLHFRYGTVSSAKSMALLSVAHSYTLQGKKVLCGKPGVDDRDGADMIASKCGFERKADVVIGRTSDGSKEFSKFDLSTYHVVLIDESQFLLPEAIDYLQHLSHKFSKPVLCYGLRSDCRTNLFPGSQRLMEIASTLEEIVSICWYCTKKALFNLRLVDGKPTTEGPSIALGGLESYLPVCARCYKQKLDNESVPRLC